VFSFSFSFSFSLSLSFCNLICQQWVNLCSLAQEYFSSEVLATGEGGIVRIPRRGAHQVRVWLVRISQVVSSTPFLCCSRFSPIAFNLSNTKPSIQLLFVLTVPFSISNQPDRIQRDRPYTAHGRAGVFNLCIKWSRGSGIDVRTAPDTSTPEWDRNPPVCPECQKRSAEGILWCIPLRHLVLLQSNDNSAPCLQWHSFIRTQRDCESVLNQDNWGQQKKTELAMIYEVEGLKKLIKKTQSKGLGNKVEIDSIDCLICVYGLFVQMPGIDWTKGVTSTQTGIWLGIDWHLTAIWLQFG
jgi:hypothetical protein